MLREKDVVLEMAIKVFFLLSFIGLASSTLPFQRICDTPQDGDKPTICTNHRNIKATYEKNKKLGETLQVLEDDLDGLEEKIGNNSIFFEEFAKSVSQSLAEITNITKHQQLEISHLKKEVSELVKHKNQVTGDFNGIEQRLELTESQLEEKKAKLENLENKTEAAFNASRRLLSLYESELSRLNTTAQDLEDRVEARLNDTKTDLGDELRKVQKEKTGFSARLDHYWAEFSHLKRHTNSRLGNVSQQLKTQNLTINQLKNETAALASNLELIEENLPSEVNQKVAFSATIISSPHVFTGPRTPGSKKVLIFDKVFTNIGKAYNNHTGIFTAPVKGVYQFTFMTFGYHSHSSGAILLKNGHYQVSTWELTGPDVSDTTSNTVILELNVGDCVNIILWQGGKIHTSVFSGFLIFPLM